MALFTDGGIATLEDLTAEDSGLLAVVGPEGIDTTRKLSLAQDEMGMELAGLLPRVGVGLDNVVVTTSLRVWHVFRTLEAIYRDAYHSQLNDRYKGKWEEYRKLARWAQERMLEAGIGIAADPMARAAAPEIVPLTGSMADGTYYVCMTWVNGSGEEGAASAWNATVVGADAGIRVTPGVAPANARGWNVYAGVTAEEMLLQNDTPLSTDESWTCVSPPRTEGREPASGQAPSFTRVLPRILQRG